MKFLQLSLKCRVVSAVACPTFTCTQGFRSNAALEALAKASENKVQNIVLYNYPSFSGAYSALFAYLFHSHLSSPCLILPFSSVEPLRVEDVCINGLKTCYFLDFLGPKGFAAELSRKTMCQVIAFEHRKSAVSKITIPDDCSQKLTFYVDTERSSSTMAYEYFSAKLLEMRSNDELLIVVEKAQYLPFTRPVFLLLWNCFSYVIVDFPLRKFKAEIMNLLNGKEQDHVEKVLKYIEDLDLRRGTLADIKAFHIGLSECRSHLNCITNPHMYKQLPKICAIDLISKGNSQIRTRQEEAKKLLDRVFRVRLGRGFYGDCLGVRADGNPSLSDEIGKELSMRSSEAGLRPIGAVIYMQGKNLKMCLRSTDKATDTSEVAKAYGGGGSPCSSSFIIRMDEYNQWLSVSTS